MHKHILFLAALLFASPAFADAPSAISPAFPAAVITSARAHAEVTLTLSTGQWMRTQSLQGPAAANYLRATLLTPGLIGTNAFPAGTPVLLRPSCATAQGSTPCEMFANKKLQIWANKADLNAMPGKSGLYLIDIKNITDAAFVTP